MTDIREKVARAILEADPTCNYDKCKARIEADFARGEFGEQNWWEALHRKADAALEACGYQKMREALKKIAEDYEEYEFNPKSGKYDKPTFSIEILAAARAALGEDKT